MVFDTIENISDHYDLICADPPWKQSRGGKKSVRKNSSGVPLPYQTCDLETIEEHLKIATEHSNENSILFFMDNR